MNDQRWERYAAWSGLIFFVLLVIAFAVLPAPPDFDAPASDIANYYVDHQDGIRVSVLLLTAALLFLVWFIGTLRAALALAEGGGRRLANLVYGTGLVAIAAIGLCQGAVAVAALHPELTSPEVLRTLHDFSFVGLVPLTGIFFAFFLATGVAIRRVGVLPAWLGTFALVVAVIQVLGIGPMLTDDGAFAADGVLGGFLPLIAFAVWFPAASFALATRVPDGDTGTVASP
jgi:hypothetical protein